MELDRYNLSFSGCGFMCIYHAGVIAAIKEYAPQLATHKVCGASAGAIAAAGLVCNVCISKAASTILQVVTQARQKLLGPLDTNFHLMDLVRVGLDDALPDNAHILCTGRLQVSLTRVDDGVNVIVEDFNTKAELIQAILCSCFIPFYCGVVPPSFRGVQYWDGGLSDNQPMVDQRTITVSPFSGESDICPPDFESASLFGFDFKGTSIRFTSENVFRILSCLFPPSQENCSWICRQGFEDALRFLTRTGLTPCIRCLTIKTDVLAMPNHSVSHGHGLRSKPSSIHLHRPRVGSECDMCFEKMEPKIHSGMTTILFPQQMQDTLDKAAAAENWIIKYLFTFRAIRYTWRFMLPAMVPLQYTLFALRRITEWIASLPVLNAVTRRFRAIVEFITSEIERCRYPISNKLSCYYNVTQYQSVVPPENTTTSSRPPLTGAIASKASGVFAGGDDDSMNNLIEYSSQHDAVLAFYYTDDDNRTQVCQIFDMLHPQRVPNRYSNACNSRECRPSVISEQGDKEDAAVREEPIFTLNSPGHAEDSGLSLTEDNNPGPHATRRTRDASCSPVRQLSTGSTRSSLRSSGGRGSLTRRVNSQRRGVSIRADGSVSASSNIVGGGVQKAARTFSSDSDPETGGEMLFVTNRRKRNTSDEYDGGPEQSDTDRGA